MTAMHTIIRSFFILIFSLIGIGAQPAGAAAPADSTGDQALTAASTIACRSLISTSPDARALTLPSAPTITM